MLKGTVFWMAFSLIGTWLTENDVFTAKALSSASIAIAVPPAPVIA
jgi:hypothetical protein